MPNLTPNLSLKKPLKTESYTIIDVTNDNMDILDADIGDKTYTENNYVLDDESLTSSIDSLDMSLKDVSDNVSSKATYNVYTATIPYTSWTGDSAPYSKAVTVTGIVSTDKPILDIVPSGTYATDITMQLNWSKIYRAVTSTNTITFYAKSIPSADIPFIAKVVK